jgi:LuxR family maltose regulon positive regulatory protein
VASPAHRSLARSGNGRITLASAASFDLLETKLHAPGARPGIVTRDGLVDRLEAAQVPVIAVVAPPGYGKTTLLSQLATRRETSAAWVSADVGDDDPFVLLSYIVEAVARVAGPRSRTDGPPRLASAIAAMRRPMTLIIDNLESVTNWESWDVLAELALGLPPGSQLAIGSRDALPLPTGLLRAQGRLLEVGIADLAMEREDAAALLSRAGVEPTESELNELVAHTEGWPAGLYLAALAARAGGSSADAVTFTGDDRFMGDYLRSELLERASDEQVFFLTRSAILERMCGPLCDAVVGTNDSGRVLEELEDRNLLVVPLDRRREWYRFHTLFRELLLSELRRREPEMVGDLYRRAAAWFESNGRPEFAIDHAQTAGDAGEVARLVLQLANPVWASGRSDTVLRWMEWFEANKLLEHHPAIAVHGALMFALAGRPAATERWAAAADEGDSESTLADGNTLDGTRAYLRALLCPDGVAGMRRDAERAEAGLGAASPYRATMLHAKGLSYLLDGDVDRADVEFARALETALLANSTPAIALFLAERGIAAIARDDWASAETYTREMLSLTDGGRFDDYWSSALVFAFAARVFAERGEAASAQAHIGRAARLRPLLTYALPIVSVQALLEMARTYLALGDRGGARAVLRQADDIFRQRPALGLLPTIADELRRRVDTIEDQAMGASSLTTAELRLLPLLRTHLTFREIAERLYVSRHTVKTQAISIYRKFGVSSRSEAIDQVDRLGLLDRR